MADPVDGGDAYTLHLHTLTTPTVDDVPPILPSTTGLPRAHFRYYGNRTRGRTILKESGAYVVVDTPTADRIDAAEEAYLGGHEHEVTDATRDALVAAGFTVVSKGLDGGVAATVHTLSTDGGGA